DGALYLNASGINNTATGALALHDNTGSYNTAVGMNAGAGAHPNGPGSSNTFLGAYAAPGTSYPINHATAIGSNAQVSQSNAVVLGAAGANVGIDTSTPQSRLQIGSGGVTAYGDYLQLPVVKSVSPPPAADCNTTTFVGRLALQSTAHLTL